ncbi:uncharacterized protein LOC132737608 [Ruditapes philippinarum]|uniref:uncharacterized protein LOC132737608 n=1 Tax=Ruditapes philippinarum TaxID=129788 RepID=UPI00295AD3DC|nr:uncharacterized protein LOC132737608 [Ruditapes philippinarum]
MSRSDNGEWTIDGGCTNFDANCDKNITDKVISSIGDWRKILENGNFKHGDKIKFKVSAKNGGKVEYEYRSTFTPPYRKYQYYLNGITANEEIELGFDTFPPIHCFEQDSNCLQDALQVTDFLTQPIVTVYWAGWTDLDSGIDEYEFNIYYLENSLDDNLLRHKYMLTPSRFTSTNSSATLDLEEPGPYSVEIIVHDRAKNYKVARRIILYDNASVVDLYGEQASVIQALENGWINKKSEQIEIVWPNRFRNIRHSNGGWLNGVQGNDDISRDLDDREGKSIRTVDELSNINGIVRFDIARNVELDGNTDFIDFDQVPEVFFKSENMVYTDEEFVDGKKLMYFIRGIDAVGEFAEDNVTVMIDLSPPVIQNLWLTKGDWVNISVHSVLELNKLIIEWEAFDFHSGIHEISWKIFDNFTKTEVVHGHSYEPPQGETETIEECWSNYSMNARGANCYCSPYNGCFHKHFQVNPQVSIENNTGLISGKETGEHDFDYIIEVTAINNARLTTVQQKKITIDTSPPHEGITNDGLPGYPELDFQQTLRLNGYWDHFFDKESGVWLYTYGFNERCLNENELDIHQNASWTYDTVAEFTVDKPGKYYLTVMAYNHALDHSKPVCSDGVTIDDTPAVVSDVVIQNAVTTEGLVKSVTDETVYILYRNRELVQVENPPEICRDRSKALSDMDLQLFPHKLQQNGTRSTVKLNDNCNDLYGPQSDIISFISSDYVVDISWNVTTGPGGLHDYEVGIASEHSEIPDIMGFTTSHQHQHMRLFHPDIFDGEIFYLLIKSITQSSVTDIKVIGPLAYDSSKPEFKGEITLSTEHTNNETFLIARWDVGAFTDHGDPHSLTYEAAIGTSKGTQDVHPFSILSFGGSCIQVDNPSCTAFSTQTFRWNLHDNQDYYVTIKVKDTAGHFVTASSSKYRHYSQLPSKGIVKDVDDTGAKFVDIDDIDFQTSTSKVTARWSGFKHPHEDIRFTVCISNAFSTDFIKCEQTTSIDQYTISGLDLTEYETYYQTVIAETEVGNSTAASDGVTVVIEGDTISGIQVFDGLPCYKPLSGDLNLTLSHHDEDKRLVCQNDLEFQASTNVLQAHWTIPTEKRHYLKDINWSIEERAPVADVWKKLTEYQHLRSNATHLEISGVFLSPGRKYRISLQFCARQHCFKPVHSDGVFVVPNPPVTESLSVTHSADLNQIQVSLDRFKDSDLLDVSESYQAMNHYEWAFADEAELGRLLTKWTRIVTTEETSDTILNFTINLNGEIAFTRCWLLIIRGYTKVGLSSTVSSPIKDCQDVQQIRPSIVIDAVGDPLSTEKAHIGKDIYLEENSIWETPDEDYTPYTNILSAVWPTLRYTKYYWAVLLVKVNDPTVFYKSTDTLDLKEPCSHPDAIKCGTTEQDYVNVNFGADTLVHGYRYIICIHANGTTIHYEFWDQELDELNECSNGVTVDLTPPIPADIWIGNDKEHLYQTSTSEISVNWNSFTDVEEEGFAAHVSGITHYEVALGSSPGGVDVQQFTEIGLTNHYTFHNVRLQNGHTYYATVKAYDFTGLFSSSISEGIKVDTTPPQITKASITLPSRHITSTDFVEACWKDVFMDLESGISHYSWAVGTHTGYDDIFPFFDTEEDCASTPENENISLKEGHAYFVTVKANNKAGLFTSFSSWAFVVDSTPPIQGTVYDGPLSLTGQNVDVDYISNNATLHASWKGFHDPHTTLEEYFVNIGSCKHCEDVLVKQPIGIRTDIGFTFLQLSEGFHYFVTVTACNTAKLCSDASSDGFIVDSTPPVKGIVNDGLLDYDIQYQSSRNYIGCKWYGFTDPQSGISHYVWRVGTVKGGDNILTATEVHKHELAFIFNLHSEYSIYLPSNGTRIYCTVRAYNLAGKFVEASSNGLIIDDTPPVFTANISMSPIGTIKDGTTVLRTTLKVHWNVEDSESFIEKQYLSISSHIGGDFNLSSTRIEGIVRDYTFTGLDFHDGSYYDIKLISCNGAKLCTESIIESILVDSSPPTTGTFAINTDHAAALSRQPEGWMIWTSIYVNLAWLGFEDMHSNINTYSVNIGSQYMGSDLNQEPNTPMIVTHDTNSSFHEDGKVQTFKFETQRLKENMAVFISVTAENKVGLSSEIAHSQFNLRYGGMMQLVRRCVSYSCEGHCVCAPFGSLCHSEQSCSNLNISDNNNAIIEVNDYLDLRFPDNYIQPDHTPINTMLAAKWYIKTIQGQSPLWYEWSVGESISDTPTGIFNTATEKVWYDAGQQTTCIFTVKRDNKVLTEQRAYSVFVRAWYSSDTYAIFKSKGVTIFHSPPLSIVIKGRRVKEVIQGTSKDIDFITRQSHVYADWSGKFGGIVSKYHVYISTIPGGHDLHTLSEDLVSTVTNVNITGLSYEENTKYYTVVQAFNPAGLHTISVSDGFMLDLDAPTSGIVMDGLFLVDKHASPNSSYVQSFWHGFSDIGSGIETYEYCVSSGVEEGTCDIQPLSEVGIATRIQITPKDSLGQGSIVRGEVRARDVIGHTSKLVSSNGLIIDSTPPIRVKSELCQPNILFSSFFEESDDIKINDTVCENISSSDWMFLPGTCVSLVNTVSSIHGQTVLHIQGSIFQTLQSELHGKYRLIFQTSTIPSSNLYQSALEGYVQINGQRYIFLMYNKHNKGTYDWQKHVFFFTIDTNTTLFEIGTAMSTSVFAIDDIQFQLCEITNQEDQDAVGHVDVHTVFVHDWSSIHAEWSFIDPETDILEYFWAIGTVRGGTQLQTFMSVGRQSFARNHSLRLEHDTMVYITVVAVNAAGLRTVSYSEPILIDLTPPTCNYVYDGSIIGQDLDYISGGNLEFQWDISDAESGLKACSWAIGI